VINPLLLDNYDYYLYDDGYYIYPFRQYSWWPWY
jgi:hypothetical protein